MIGRIVLLISFVAALAANPVVLADEPAAEAQPQANAAYEMVVEGELVSLRSTGGELARIVEDLGRRLDFEVVAHGVEDQPVTVEFAGLSAHEAIVRICGTTGYVVVPDPTTDRIQRVVLIPTRSRGANRLAARRDPLPNRPAAPIAPALAVDTSVPAPDGSAPTPDASTPGPDDSTPAANNPRPGRDATKQQRPSRSRGD